MFKTPSFLPRTVIVLSAVSLLNDAASEMIAPLLPLFLTLTLGAGPAAVGFIEGLAEATASLIKLLSGRLADRGWSMKGLVLGGYSISNLMRPLIAFASGWVWILGLRFLDRVGKGLRTAPRDALISGAVEPQLRGRAFGFHRAMDHAGAVIGPLIAFALLQAHVELRHVFLFSVIPGMLVILLLVYGVPSAASTPAPAPVSTRLEWRALDHRLRALILSAGGLAFAAAPEAFLILWAAARHLDIVWVPLLWSAAHVVKIFTVMIASNLSDKIGRLPVLITGWSARVVMLILLAFSGDGTLWTWVMFLAYAGALASTEGAERAMIGDFAPSQQKATAFGLYHMLSGILALPGALMFGLLWQWFGMKYAFLTAAALTALSAIILLASYRREKIARD